MQLTFLAIGVAAGVLSGLFGIGGGIIIVPLLILGLKMQPTTATGTSLMAMLLPVGALAVWEYHKNGHVNVAGGLLIALGMFACSSQNDAGCLAVIYLYPHGWILSWQMPMGLQ